MFLGTFRPKLLSSGQISLPAKLRANLSGNKAVLTTGFESCIYGFSLTDWERIALSELTKPLSTEEGRKIRRQFFAAAEEIDLDSQGRFVIPEYLRVYAGVNGELVVVGAGDHFEIWESVNWEKIADAR